MTEIRKTFPKIIRHKTEKQIKSDTKQDRQDRERP